MSLLHGLQPHHRLHGMHGMHELDEWHRRHRDSGSEASIPSVIWQMELDQQK